MASWRWARGVGICVAAVALAGCAAAGDAADDTDATTSALGDDDDLEGRAPTREELRPSVQAAFEEESYRPSTFASFALFNTAPAVTIQIFHVGPETVPTIGRSEMHGVPVSNPVAIGAAHPGRVVRVFLGAWPSGLYFVRLNAGDGRVGFAPFVLRPHRLGAHRVAVIMPTMTWQAYNVRDDDGDGRGDTWYARWTTHHARLARPFLDRGVPYNFRSYDLPFLHWLSKNGHDVDVLADRDLDETNGAALIAAYDLIIFPGHHEYVTTQEYDAVEGFRNHGGNLMFLSANNFFWRIVKHGNVMERTQKWRDLGRPEAALIGVQYRGNDRGGRRGPWIVRARAASEWIFAGTGLASPGARFWSGGIEIDKTAPSSPRNIQIVAEIPHVFGPGFDAQMTFYQAPSGAEVFAAGAFTLAGSAGQAQVSAVLENLWTRLAQR